MPRLTVSQLSYRLTPTALDIGADGYDSQSGWSRFDFQNSARLHTAMRGKVLLPSGLAAAGATVAMSNVRSATTGSRGAYAFTKLTQGAYTATVVSRGRGVAQRTLQLRDGAPQTADRKLRAAGVVLGPVRNGATGRVMADVRVQVQNTTRRTWTSGSGGYTFWAVSPGRYKLTASKTGNSSSTRTVVVQRGVKSW